MLPSEFRGDVGTCYLFIFSLQTEMKNIRLELLNWEVCSGVDLSKNINCFQGLFPPIPTLTPHINYMKFVQSRLCYCIRDL